MIELREAGPDLAADILVAPRSTHWQPRCLKPEEWPPLDRQLWEAACTPAELLDDGGAAARLAPDSRKKYRKGYGVWLSFLMARGWLNPEVHPVKRITRPRLAAYFQAMRGLKRRGFSIIGRFQELRGMMKAIAPEHDTAWILRPNGLTIRQMVHPSTRALVVPDSVVLFLWAIEMMETADLAAPGRYGLVRFRDGLLLAMMAARGRRLRSMSLLREGQEIHLVDDQYRIELQPHQVKTKKFDSFKLPRRLTPFIRKYIAMARPTLLAGQSHEAFWIGINGEPLSAKGIEEVVFRCSRRRFGVGFGPHRFRHAIATTAALRASDALAWQHRCSASPPGSSRPITIAPTRSPRSGNSKLLSMVLAGKTLPAEGLAIHSRPNFTLFSR
jgi:hypothetical protein